MLYMFLWLHHYFTLLHVSTDSWSGCTLLLSTAPCTTPFSNSPMSASYISHRPFQILAPCTYSTTASPSCRISASCSFCISVCSYSNALHPTSVYQQQLHITALYVGLHTAPLFSSCHLLSITEVVHAEAPTHQTSITTLTCPVHLLISQAHQTNM